MEFLLVKFPQAREVLADGDVIGDTNTTLMLPAGEYLITLSGDGYTPNEQDVVLNGTASNDPVVIAFTLADVSVPVPAPTPELTAVARRTSISKRSKTKPKPKAKSKSAAKKSKVKASARRKRTAKSKSRRKSR